MAHGYMRQYRERCRWPSFVPRAKRMLRGLPSPAVVYVYTMPTRARKMRLRHGTRQHSETEESQLIACHLFRLLCYS